MKGLEDMYSQLLEKVEWECMEKLRALYSLKSDERENKELT